MNVLPEDAPPPNMQINAGEIGVGAGEGAQKGRILLVLPKPAKWVALEPPQACAIAKDMIDKAVSLGYHVEIVIPRKPISQGKRTMLVNRVNLVMRMLTEKKRDPLFIAEELVDIVLRDSGA